MTGQVQDCSGLLVLLYECTQKKESDPQQLTVPKGPVLSILREEPKIFGIPPMNISPSAGRILDRRNGTISWYEEKSHGIPRSRTQYALCILDNIFQTVPAERREHFFAQLGKRIIPGGILALLTTRDFTSSGLSAAYRSTLEEIGHWQVTHQEGYSIASYDRNSQLFEPPTFETLGAHAERSLAGKLILGGTEYMPAQYPDSAAFVKTFEEQVRRFFLGLFSGRDYEEQQARERREGHIQKVMTAFAEAHPEKPFTFTRITDYLIYLRG